MALSFVYRLVSRVLRLVRLHGWTPLPRTPRSWSSVTSWRSFAARSPDPGSPGRTGRLIASLAQLLPRERWAAFLVTPETILRWHRALVRRRWTYPRRRPGQPALPDETVALIVRLFKENPSWGYLRIVGELKKLGVTVSKSSVANVLASTGCHPHRGERVPPGSSSSVPRPRASSPPTSSQSTRSLRRYYVLFVIELERRVCTYWV